MAPPSNGTAPAAAATAANPNPALAVQQQAMMTALVQQQAAITRRARRLHVSNLPPGLTGDTLKELFNTTMQAAKLAMDEQPCVNQVHMAADNKFGFVEFRSVAETTSAMALDGMQLLGKALRVARPNDYLPPPAEMVNVMIPAAISSIVTSSNVTQYQISAVPGVGAMPVGTMGAGAMGALPGITPNTLATAGVPAQLPGLTAAADLNALNGSSIATPNAIANGIPGLNASGILSGLPPSVPAAPSQQLQNLQSITRRARRLHVGNLPQGVGLNPEMLKQFFNAAMISASLHDTSKEGDPVIESMLGSEGKYGFIEFRTIAEATSCMALNNIELGGKQLRVERPRDYAPMPPSMLDSLREAGVLGNTTIAPDGQDLLSGNQATPSVGATIASLVPSTNALAPLDVTSPSPVLVLDHMVTLAEASSASEMAEVLEDAKGECERHGKITSAFAPKLGTSSEAAALKVYVRFETSESAVAAARALHGKQFDGRTVIATFADESTLAAVTSVPCHEA